MQKQQYVLGAPFDIQTQAWEQMDLGKQKKPIQLIYFRIALVGLFLFAHLIATSPNAFADAHQIQSAEDVQIAEADLPAEQPDSTVETHEILVGLRTTSDVRAASAAVVSEIVAIVGQESVANISDLDTRGIGSVSCDDTSVQGLRMVVQTADVSATAAGLAQHPDILFAVPNAPVYAANHPLVSDWSNQAVDLQSATGVAVTQSASEEFEIDDPLFTNQQWYMDLINGKAAIAEATTSQAAANSGNGPTVVAIIDSGIDIDHAEFNGRLLPGYNYLVPSSPPIDDYGHGTHVAGLIGATVNNTLGIAGISPNVQILPYKTLDQNGGGRIDNVVKAICRAVDDGADIINLSLTSPSQNTDQYSSAFEYAREKDVLMIAAAGNSRQSRNMWPARLPDVMAIAATDPDGELASYSSPGDSIDMAAPGGEFDQQLLSTWPADVGCSGMVPLTDGEGGRYCDSIGTSMAAALVSGVAATLKEFHPDVEANDIRNVLIQTANTIPDEDVSNVGGGMLDAQRAVIAGLAESKVVVSTQFDTRVIPLNSPPFTIDVEVSNPSFSKLNWQATVDEHDWIELSQSGDSIGFDSTNTLSIRIDPAELAPRIYFARVAIIGEKDDGSLLEENVNVEVLFRVDSEPSPEGQLIVLSESDLEYSISDRSEPFSTTISFKNVGAGDIIWSAELVEQANLEESWIDTSMPMTGTVSYLESVEIPVQFTPQKARLGQNRADVILRGTRDDGSITEATAEILLDVVPSTLLPLYLAPGQ